MQINDDPLIEVIARAESEFYREPLNSFASLPAALAAAVRSFLGSDEVVELAARASFAFRHQGDISDPGQVWDAPEKGPHPLYWQQKMEHNHPHYRAMARAALSAAIGE